MAMTFTARSARRSRGSVAAGRLRWCDIGTPLPHKETRPPAHDRIATPRKEPNDQTDIRRKLAVLRNVVHRLPFDEWSTEQQVAAPLIVRPWVEGMFYGKI